MWWGCCDGYIYMARIMSRTMLEGLWIGCMSRFIWMDMVSKTCLRDNAHAPSSPVFALLEQQICLYGHISVLGAIPRQVISSTHFIRISSSSTVTLRLDEGVVRCDREPISISARLWTNWGGVTVFKGVKYRCTSFFLIGLNWRYVSGIIMKLGEVFIPTG